MASLSRLDLTHSIEIRQLTTLSDAAAVALVGSLAYTSFGFYNDSSLPTFVQRVMHSIERPNRDVYGMFHTADDLKDLDTDSYNTDISVEATPGQQLTSTTITTTTPVTVTPTPGLIAHWFHMHFHLGGLGFVAVDLKHKKRGYAKVLVTQWLKDCNERRQYLAALHPFRPDFYGNMGFGLSKSRAKGEPTYLGLKTLKVAHVEELVACQNRFSDQRHGMIQPLVYADLENVLRGYILFKFETSTAGGLINDLKIVDLVYETTEALFAILQFLREQDDQVRYIKITTQETDLFRLLADPRSAHTAGEQAGIHGAGRESAKQTVSLMYKVVNIEKLFSEYFSDRDFNGVDGLKLWIRMEDTLTPELNPPVLVSFVNGFSNVVAVGGDYSGEADAVLDIGVAEFSSLVVGAVSLKVLARYGKAFVSPRDKLALVSKAFLSEDLPINSVFF
ncbi:acyl-CoA N-acyltransferase [Obelidium mucronatum]|nr:acyl-CoA N-acyltransferase [Obelidium mucronatum]